MLKKTIKKTKPVVKTVLESDFEEVAPAVVLSGLGDAPTQDTVALDAPTEDASTADSVAQ